MSLYFLKPLPLHDRIDSTDMYRSDPMKSSLRATKKYAVEALDKDPEMSMPTFEEIEGTKKGLILKGLNFQGFQI